MNIWFTSDTHYSHKNICKGSSSWEDKSGCRDFKDQNEMNDIMVNNINKVVKSQDILYHLGDWSFGGIDNIYKFWKRLVCKNIHLVLGNHDKHIENNYVLSDLLEESKGVLNSSDIKEEDLAGAQNLFLSVSNYKEISINGQFIVLCHYPIISHNKCHKGSWMIHGHCHGSLEPEYYKGRKMIDVDIYGHPEFRPYNLNEIRKIMNNIEITNVDHHELS